MRIESFLWDQRNVEHIARHGISPKEVEEIPEGPYRVVRAGPDRYALYGQSQGGRYLVAIISLRGTGQAYPITAREMTKGERRRFRRL
ncbi:MAG: BrnT family toxin [Elusimicrobia bacterium]|nr:BrnT family toxin [Elusimicrobiota bacterium]